MFYDHVSTTFYSGTDIFILYFCDKRNCAENQSVSVLGKDVARGPSSAARNVSFGYRKC